ncbi:unnamed protein product [Calypogeia fissa]
MKFLPLGLLSKVSGNGRGRGPCFKGHIVLGPFLPADEMAYQKMLNTTMARDTMVRVSFVFDFSGSSQSTWMIKTHLKDESKLHGNWLWTQHQSFEGYKGHNLESVLEIKRLTGICSCSKAMLNYRHLNRQKRQEIKNVQHRKRRALQSISSQCYKIDDGVQSSRRPIRFRQFFNDNLYFEKGLHTPTS